MSKENQPVEETTAETQAEQTSDLNINDLNTLRAIIDLASSRGAFKTAEMVAVGSAYNKLNAFLEKIAKQSESANGEQSPEGAE